VNFEEFYYEDHLHHHQLKFFTSYFYGERKQPSPTCTVLTQCLTIVSFIQEQGLSLANAHSEQSVQTILSAIADFTRALPIA